MTVKNFISTVNPLYLVFNEINGYIEESNGNKYLTPVSTDESKDILKKYEELWSKLRDIIILKTNDSKNYDENSVEINILDDDLPLKKTLEIYNMVITVRIVFMRIANIIHKFSWTNVCIDYKCFDMKWLTCLEKLVLVEAVVLVRVAFVITATFLK